MLAGAVRELLSRGATVFSVSRAPERLSVPAQYASHYIPVPANWKDPLGISEKLIAALQAAHTTTVDAALIWIHSAYRPAVVKHIEPIINPQGMLMHVWGTAGILKSERLRTRNIDTRHVILGSVADMYSSRWLNHEEISGAVIHAWDYPHCATPPLAQVPVCLIEESTPVKVFQVGDRY
ncbi:short chain dehydrogenase [Corynebacterium felinum]|nr:short chain dehydrogenase [Corynebacterium felinum]